MRFGARNVTKSTLVPSGANAGWRRSARPSPCTSTALMFGTDLPGTRARRAFREQDLAVIADAVGDDLNAVLDGNARVFYRL